MSATGRVAAWAHDLRWQAIPPELKDWLGLRVADSVAVIGNAWGSPPGTAVLDVARASSGPAPLLFEPTRVMPSYAAMAHGTLCHTYDYDDTYPESVVHPSSVVVPAAIAAGHEGSGEAAMVGMLAGYEFLARSGAAAGRGFHRRGFHATGVLGPVAAALVAGIVTAADEQVIVNAMGLAGSMSGGLLEFLADATWSKRLHPGWAAHGGLVAMQLAAAGFTGPASILEGKDGVFASFLHESPAALEEQLSDIGERWACLSLETKLFPCAHVIHPYLDLLLTFGADQQLDPEAIAGITCHVAPWAVPIVAEPLAQKRAPRNEYEARASLPFALAVAVVDGSFAASSLGDEALGRPVVLATAAKIDIVENDALDRQFPAQLEIRFSNGDVANLHSSMLRAGNEDVRLREKFDRNLGSLTDSEGRRRIWDAATGLAGSTPAELAATCAAVTDDLS